MQPGDRVIIYMPMTIESLIAIHACARIGATHVIVFGGFSAHELANRITDSNPKLVICSNAGKEPSRIINYKALVDDALKLSNRTNIQKIILQRTNLMPAQILASNEHDFFKV